MASNITQADLELAAKYEADMYEEIVYVPSKDMSTKNARQQKVAESDPNVIKPSYHEKTKDDCPQQHIIHSIIPLNKKEESIPTLIDIEEIMRNNPSEICPSFSVRDKPLEDSTITSYVNTMNIIHKVLKNVSLPVSVKEELRRLLRRFREENVFEEVDDSLIIEALDYLATDIDETIYNLRMHYKNDSTFKNRIIALAVVTAHLNNVDKQVHQKLSKVAIYVNEKMKADNKISDLQGLGYIYILQETEYKDTNVFKIGRTIQDGEDSRTLCRIKSYPKNTVMHNIFRVYNNNAILEIENAIKTLFTRKYKLVRGTEWFEGNVRLMKRDIDYILELMDF